MLDKRLYLRLGDKVVHMSYDEWGEGSVVEEMTSSVPGGTCLVRILFRDGRQRTFNNDLDNELCCYHFGVRRLWQPASTRATPLRRSNQRRLSSR